MAKQDPDEWTQRDAIALRDFIAGNPKFLRVLVKRRPKIEGSTMEARAVTGSDVNGFLLAAEAIETLCLDPHQGVEDAGFLPEERSADT